MVTTGIVMGGVPATVGEMKPGGVVVQHDARRAGRCALNAFW